MNMKPAAVAVALLAACSDNDGPVATMNELPYETLGDALASDPGTMQGAAKAAGDNLPPPGSLTQSSNAGSVVGVTGDAASVSFDGSEVRFAVVRDDGSSIELDSATDTVLDEPFSAPGLPDRDGRSYGMGKLDGAGNYSAAHVVVIWGNSDPSDYLAGGYWMHFAGVPEEIAGAELGAFVDGPELSGPAKLPELGTASYRGLAGGLFTTRYGTDAGEAAMVGSVPAGSMAFGEFDGTIDLTADFADLTISGCLGCTGDIATSGYFEDGATGEGSDFEATSDSNIHLGPTPINQDGSFRNRAVRFESPGFTVTSTTGAWGGQFSNVPHDNGNPRLVAGTIGGEARTAGGTETAFIGSYYGGVQGN